MNEVLKKSEMGVLACATCNPGIWEALLKATARPVSNKTESK